MSTPGRPAARRKARGRGWRAVPWWGWLLASPFLAVAVAVATALTVASGGLAIAAGAAIGIAICQPRIGRRQQPHHRRRGHTKRRR